VPPSQSWGAWAMSYIPYTQSTNEQQEQVNKDSMALTKGSYLKNQYTEYRIRIFSTLSMQRCAS